MGTTYSQPLRVVGLRRSKQGIERVVARDAEAGKVGEELTTEIEKNHKEVQRNSTDNGVSLGHRGLLLNLVEDRILRQLEIKISVRPRMFQAQLGSEQIAFGNPGRTSLSSCPMYCWRRSWGVDMAEDVVIGLESCCATWKESERAQDGQKVGSRCRCGQVEERLLCMLVPAAILELSAISERLSELSSPTTGSWTLTADKEVTHVGGAGKYSKNTVG